ncbi:toxin TcdB middle/N-terminal domain-containing protein [Rhodohalobacter sp.]|uniref:toxin TcdB middle/N-terminal domain-containing protein n=1 Tax=Rhodohalobacter sp. TaxID=1974210 RepID=UPI002ACD242B|nr:toxin TcdB middle/N-terminal domain-containing protein [Rhodohalobacter sp.]MDZ7757527.1 toxin TcdB middle/N-terminal domain-containing protein [Rhodohalobacter sp.]
MRDIDGDGLADLVVRLSDDRFPDRHRHLFSYRNTGSGFDSLENPLNGNTALEQVQTECEGFVLGGTLRNGNQGYQRRLIDLDTDGLLDMIWFEGGPSITETSSVKAKFNLGGRFGETVTLLYPEKWGLSKRLFTAEWEPEDFVGNWHIVNDFTDANGDGLADLAQWHAPGGGSTSPTMTYVNSPGLPAAPDLLSRVTNGRGKVLNFFYKSSSNPEVVQWGGSGNTMPTPRWVVSKSVVEGGFETPATTTHSSTQQPNYNSMAVHSDYKERSQFAGFSQNIQTSNYSNGTSKQIRKLYDYEGLHADLIEQQDLS